VRVGTQGFSLALLAHVAEMWSDTTLFQIDMIGRVVMQDRKVVGYLE
jgi:hypothetical protein